jgi:predicted Na+-dependent transporter
LSNWTFNEEISNVSNLSWMKRIGNYFILVIVVGNMSEKVVETIQSLSSHKKTNVYFELLQILVN